MDTVQQSLQALIQQFLLFAPKLVVALLIFVVTLYAAGFIARAIRRTAQFRKVDPELILLFERVGRWSVIILGTIWALSQVNFNVVAFVAGLGIAGFTIGFALQDIAKNFVAGILLLLQQPFDIGEAISAGGHSGKVENISLRATELRTFDGLLVYIPNADVFTSALTNYSRAPRRRIELQVGVAYGSNLEHVTRVTLEAVRQVPGVIQNDPAPAVVFKSFGESSIDFSLYYWVDLDQAGYWAAQDQVLKAVHSAFQHEGIEIPFPVRTVYLQPTTEGGVSPSL